jgi:hypothetical protein
MTRKLNFIWIDDTGGRKKSAMNMEHALGVKINFWDVNDKSLEDELKSIVSSKQPDLIIIDHKLEDIATGLFKTGSNAAMYIHEKWNKCPIICVSGVDEDEVTTHQKSMYLDIFSFAHLSNHYGAILSIANGFNLLKKKPPKSIEELAKLLKVPGDDMSRLISVLPFEIKNHFTNESLFNNIANWIRNVLINRPGFLYDRLWVSTLLGIKESSFKKVEALFAEAEYKGLFSDAENKRWWKSLVLEILSTNVPGHEMPWKKGRSLPKIKKQDHSKCHVSNDDYPETVGFLDENSKTRVQLKIFNSIPHPKYDEILYFEKIRMMKPAE